MLHVILTVADHEKNGFVSLARWPDMSEAEARSFIARQDDGITDESEPDIKTAPFTFILDLMDADGDMIGNSERCLPTQNAMALAPDQVRRWLEERPVPDCVINQAVPLVPFPLPACPSSKETANG